jgi:hypothetical protein
MTLPISQEPTLYASVFQNCSFKELIKAINAGFKTDDRLVIVPHHANLPRATDDRHRSTVNACEIIIQEGVSSDWIPDGEGGRVRNSHHKFGGEPFCIQEPELPGASELFDSGYVQVAQVDFPGPEDGSIEGDWPFLDGVFNLFGLPPLEQSDYKWYLQK